MMVMRPPAPKKPDDGPLSLRPIAQSHDRFRLSNQEEPNHPSFPT
jgi:hypothetical protein